MAVLDAIQMAEKILNESGKPTDRYCLLKLGLLKQLPNFCKQISFYYALQASKVSCLRYTRED